MKNKLRPIVLFVASVALSFIIFSCGNSKKADSDEIVLEGRFIHSRANIVYFDVIHVESTERIDSIVLDEDGAFQLRYPTKKPVFIKLFTAEDNFITLVAEPGELITLSGDINALAESYTVSGSPASELVAKYLEFTRGQYKQLDTLSLIWENNKYSNNKLVLRDSLDSLAKTIFSDQRNHVLDVIHKNPESLGSLFVLYQFFGRNPVLDPFEYFNDYESLAKTLSAKYPDFEHVGHLNMRVNKTRLAIQEEEEIKLRLDTGKVAPDFTLPDINEKMVRLSDLKGNIVLVHFWASWSAESVRQLSALRYYNQIYGPKGLVILSVSFDYDKDMWEKAIDDEDMKWYNLSDLKYTDSPISKLYHIEQTPYFYLLDRNQTITKKSSNIDDIGNAIYKLFFAH
jgi:peroxiredoxin